MSGGLDVTTLEQFMDQMPAGRQVDRSRSGESRMIVWTFPDGSQLEGTFRPKDGEGGGQDLVLYMVDMRDRGNP